MTRRNFFLASAATALAGWLFPGWLPLLAAPDGNFPLNRSEEDWRKLLSLDQFNILRRHATERAYTSALLEEHRKGIFSCAGCEQPLFSSDSKFDSGTGWPSFWAPLENAVGTMRDTTHGMIRIEVHCRHCGGHLGHVFNDGPKPTGLRYCMNGAALKFTPQAASAGKDQP